MAIVTSSIAALETQLKDLGLSSPLPEIPNLDVLAKPLDIYRSHLASLLAATIDCDVMVAYDAIASTNDIALGDLAVILPRLRMKLDDLDSLAMDITTKLPESPLLQLPYLDGVHLRIFFSSKTLPRLLLPYIHDRNSSYGGQTSDGPETGADIVAAGRNVVVEFSSPNIGPDFSTDHLRSTIIGEFISRIHEAMGWSVTRLNYIGDWGKHIGLLAAGWQRFGSEDSLNGNDPLGHILDVYAKIVKLFQPEQELSRQAKNNEEAKAEIESMGIFAERDNFFKRMEGGDDEALSLWKRWCEVSIAHFTTSYDRLGIRFDEYSGESKVRQSTTYKVEAILTEKGISEEIDGSVMINFDKHGDKGKGLGTQPIRGRTGSTTYLLRDITAVLDREEAHSFDKMIYVVSSRQKLHFQQVLRTLELMGRGELAAKITHVSFGGIQGKSALTAARTLDEMIESISKIIQDQENSKGSDATSPPVVTDIETIACLLSQDMSSKLIHGYTFDPRNLSTTEENSGQRLQRYQMELSSLLAHPEARDPPKVETDYAALEQEANMDILRVMAQYPDVVATTFKSLEPHGILTYLTRLVDTLAYALDNDDAEVDADEAGPTAIEQKEDSPGARKAQIELYRCVKQVLENGMKLLGLPMTSA